MEWISSTTFSVKPSLRYRAGGAANTRAQRGFAARSVEGMCAGLLGRVPLWLVERLALTPRAGKAIRLTRSGIALPARSVLDHVLSLARYADVLTNLGMVAPDRPALARCIVFHDLAEAFSGDAPEFTDAGSPHISDAAAIARTAASMPRDLRGPYRETIRLLRSGHSRTRAYFRMLDKTDPIIAVWRYLTPVESPPALIAAMRDFFENPGPAQTCLYPEVSDFVRWLQVAEHARAGSIPGPGMSAVLFERLVTGCGAMLCAPRNYCSFASSARFKRPV
jgi:5'-deoxynucleotidase YfbR-like HD superfamily hydrolase